MPQPTRQDMLPHEGSRFILWKQGRLSRQIFEFLIFFSLFRGQQGQIFDHFLKNTPKNQNSKICLDSLPCIHKMELLTHFGLNLTTPRKSWTVKFGTENRRFFHTNSPKRHISGGRITVIRFFNSVKKFLVLHKGTGQNLWGTQAGFIGRGAKTFLWWKKGGDDFFRPKKREAHLFFLQIKWARNFFSKTKKRAKTFLGWKKGGRKLFWMQKRGAMIFFDQKKGGLFFFFFK